MPADWNRLLRFARGRREHRGFDYGSLPAIRLPCEMVLTVDRAGWFNVRCRCMAQTTWKRPPERFFAYDWLGRTRKAAEAAGIYREHLAEKARAAA